MWKMPAAMPDPAVRRQAVSLAMPPLPSVAKRALGSDATCSQLADTVTVGAAALTRLGRQWLGAMARSQALRQC